MNQCVQEENEFYGTHVRSLEHQMEAKIAQGQRLLQEELCLHHDEVETQTHEDNHQLRREVQEALDQHGLEVATASSLRQLLERERERENNAREQSEAASHRVASALRIHHG